MVILAIVVFLMTCTLILRALDAGLAPPGKLYWVDGGKYRLHVYCRGNQTDDAGSKLPTVLLEGGEGPVEDGLWQFADNAIKNGSISRYCFVDRPGFAWVSISWARLKTRKLIENRAIPHRHLSLQVWLLKLLTKHWHEPAKMAPGVGSKH
jgi:hypothetical protein